MLSCSGRNRTTSNYLKTIYFDTPEWVPCEVGFLPATWMHHREALEDLVLRHPRIFPSYKKGSVDFDQKVMGHPLYELGRHTDCWGVVWNNIHRGFDSYVELSPLADWSSFPEWKKHLPDPLQDDSFGPRPPWSALEPYIAQGRSRGELVKGGRLPHGFFFMLLYYLRGFDNLMLDLASDDPRIHELAEILTRYNAAVVKKQLDMGMELMSFGEDLGMQRSLPVSPQMWRAFVTPGYEATIGQCRDRDVPVFLHSDGHILEIIPDLIELGVRVLNPQIRANGLAGLQEVARGRVALCQDLDRQMFPFATPDEIEAHIECVFGGLYLKRGGLMLQAECGPDVPLENIEAVCRAMERLCDPPDLGS